MEGVLPGVRIGETPYGRGVFATQAYRPGQAVGRIHGRILEDPEFSSDYCIDLGEDRSMDPVPPFRYLNHSCEPNCELTYVEVHDECGRLVELEVWVQAIRAVEPGSQLTIDYAWPAEASIPCGCRSPNCRGWIVAAEQAHLVRKAHARRRRGRRRQAGGRR